jgi:Major intrinsic protein
MRRTHHSRDGPLDQADRRHRAEAVVPRQPRSGRRRWHPLLGSRPGRARRLSRSVMTFSASPWGEWERIITLPVRKKRLLHRPVRRRTQARWATCPRVGWRVPISVCRPQESPPRPEERWKPNPTPLRPASLRPPGGGEPEGAGNYSTAFADSARSGGGCSPELLGTFLLTLVAAGRPVIAAATHRRLGHAVEVVALSLMVMAITSARGHVSGAHLNPAVTLTFTLRKVFPWTRVLGYWAAQVAWAVLAALLVRVLFRVVGHLGATLPHHGQETSLVMEIVLTGVPVTIILGRPTRTASSPQRRPRRRRHHRAARPVRQPDQRSLDEPSPVTRPRPRRGNDG